MNIRTASTAAKDLIHLNTRITGEVEVIERHWFDAVMTKIPLSLRIKDDRCRNRSSSSDIDIRRKHRI